MSDEKKYDIAVIGSGPGGYVAAIKAAQTGAKVAIIEKGPLGGVCLNVGCIPTKALLTNATLLEKFRKASEFGIHVGEISFDYKKMKQRKDEVVARMRKGVETLMQTNRIEVLKGEASFQSPREIKIKGQDNLIIHADKIIIASGSEPLEIFPCDHKRYLQLFFYFGLRSTSKSIAIIGGGYIGCIAFSFCRARCQGHHFRGAASHCEPPREKHIGRTYESLYEKGDPDQNKRDGRGH